MMREQILSIRSFRHDGSGVIYDLRSILPHSKVTEIAKRFSDVFYEQEVSNWITFNGKFQFPMKYRALVIIQKDGETKGRKIMSLVWRFILKEKLYVDYRKRINQLLTLFSPVQSVPNPIAGMTIKRSVRKKMIEKLLSRIKENTDIIFE